MSNLSYKFWVKFFYAVFRSLDTSTYIAWIQIERKRHEQKNKRNIKIWINIADLTDEHKQKTVKKIDKWKNRILLLKYIKKKIGDR